MGPDPGGLRLAFACRVLVAVTLTLLALGFMVAQFSVAAVRDPTPRGQVITTLVMPLPGLIGITAASLLARAPVARDVGLLAMIFVAVLMRAFGSRGVALGVLGFIAYYIGSALHPRPGLLFYDVPAVAIATATVLLVRFLLLPERSERTLLRILRALRRRTARLVGVLAQRAATGKGGTRFADTTGRYTTRRSSRGSDKRPWRGATGCRFNRPRNARIRVRARGGAAVALLLLPTRTSEILHQAGRDFAERVRAAVEAASRATGGAKAQDPLIAARAVDRSLRRLVQSSGALSRGWAVAAPERILQLVRAATACTFWIRELAAGSRSDSKVMRASSIARHFEALDADLDELVSALDKGGPLAVRSEPEETAEPDAEIATAPVRLRRSLWQFTRALAEATRRF